MTEAKAHPLVTPGEILLEEFLQPLGITRAQLAQATGISRARISRIVRGKQTITADTAQRLGAFFGIAPQFWLRLQEGYNSSLRLEKRRVGQRTHLTQSHA